jgi:tetratricopeptide (TPR) repeat protein
MLPSKWFYAVVISLVFVFLSVFALAQAPATPSPSPSAADMNPNDPDRQEAIRLYHKHKLPEAAAMLEKIVEKYPKDTAAHEALGASLVSRADTQTEPEKRKADRLHARAELLRAKELGDNSDLCNVLLAGIPEDGSVSAFSDSKEVDAAMGRGEAAFAQGDWATAIKEYKSALELDPKLYLAAVNIGDTYYRLKQFDTAGEWFAKAVQLDPNREVGYRYWGDVLMADGKMKEAREKFIQGLVAFPYTKTSWVGLNGWLSHTHLAYKKIPIQLPQAPTSDAKGNSTITIDPASLGKDDGGAAWLMYSMERVLWKNEKFAKEYPQEKAYRHSLKEETSALSLVVTVYGETQHDKKAKKPDPSLIMLSQLEKEGLLEPYVLLVKADNGIAQDYFSYRDQHRDKLIQFVSNYIVPPAP